jgi:hypothetical protein
MKTWIYSRVLPSALRHDHGYLRSDILHTAERAAPLTHKNSLRRRLYFGMHGQPYLDGLELITPERVRRGQISFQPRDLLIRD